MKKKIYILIALLIYSILFVDLANAKVTPQKLNAKKIDYINIPFWQHFNDDLLIENLITVYQNNHDLKATNAKVNEVKRLVKMSFANELPQLEFNGYVGYTFSSADTLFGSLTIPNYHQSQFLLPITYSYEVDIWGKNRLKTKSQKKNLEIIEQDEKTIYITLTSAFANIYFNLVKADKLIEYQNELISVQTKYVNSIKKQYEHGVVTINDVIAAQKFLTYQKEELYNLLEKQDLLQNQLSVMLADRAFNSVKRTAFNELKADIQVPNEINIDVLESRPDRMKSKLKLEKCGIDIKIARRNFLPTFTIVGNLGFNFYNLSSSHKFLSDIGVVPNWDLFAGGRKIAMLKMQKDKYDLAIQEYEKSILTSFQETNDSLFSLKSNQKKYEIAQERLSYDKKEYELTELKENAGIADDLDLLIRKEKMLISQKEEVSSKINEIIALIQLYQAMGGVDFYNTDTNL